MSTGNKSVDIKYSVNGSSVSVISLNPDTIKDTLAPKIYSIKYSQQQGFFLEIIRESFGTPKKIYGDHFAKVDKIIGTYLDRTKSTGVVLSGDKGSGKSLILELVCNEMLKKNVPVITVNQAYQGDAFLEFVDKLGEVVLVFDEFDKLYYNNSGDPETAEVGATPQESLLTLLEGLYSRKRLVLLSANDDYKVNQFLKNRPGRIYYYMRFDKLSEKITKDYCVDKLVPENIVKEIVDVRNMAREFSFDILQGLVEEYTRFKTPTLKEILPDLNIEVKVDYEVNLIKVVNKKTNKQVKGVKLDEISTNVTSEDVGTIYVKGKELHIGFHLQHEQVVKGDEYDVADTQGYLIFYKLVTKQPRAYSFFAQGF